MDDLFSHVQVLHLNLFSEIDLCLCNLHLLCANACWFPSTSVANANPYRGKLWRCFAVDSSTNSRCTHSRRKPDGIEVVRRARHCIGAYSGTRVRLRTLLCKRCAAA